MKKNGRDSHACQIKTSYALGERLPENFEKDVNWINERRLELYEQYGDCVILVYHEELVGTGDSIPEAVADAEKRLSERDGIITPVVKYQSSPYRIGLYRRKKD